MASMGRLDAAADTVVSGRAPRCRSSGRRAIILLPKHALVWHCDGLPGQASLLTALVGRGERPLTLANIMIVFLLLLLPLKVRQRETNQELGRFWG